MREIPNIILRTSALATMFAATPLYACRVPTEPFNPALARSDVIIVGRIAEIRHDVLIPGKWFRVHVKAVVAGQFPEATYEMGWATGPGACGPLGPDVAEGDQVTVYFLYRDGRRIKQGWTKNTVQKRWLTDK